MLPIYSDRMVNTSSDKQPIRWRQKENNCISREILNLVWVTPPWDAFSLSMSYISENIAHHVIASRPIRSGDFQLRCNKCIYIHTGALFILWLEIYRLTKKENIEALCLFPWSSQESLYINLLQWRSSERMGPYVHSLFIFSGSLIGYIISQKWQTIQKENPHWREITELFWIKWMLLKPLLVLIATKHSHKKERTPHTIAHTFERKPTGYTEEKSLCCFESNKR